MKRHAILVALAANQYRSEDCTVLKCRRVFRLLDNERAPGLWQGCVSSVQRKKGTFPTVRHCQERRFRSTLDLLNEIDVPYR